MRENKSRMWAKIKVQRVSPYSTECIHFSKWYNMYIPIVMYARRTGEKYWLYKKSYCDLHTIWWQLRSTGIGVTGLPP